MDLNLADLDVWLDFVPQFLGHHRLRKELATYRPVIQISAIANCDILWKTSAVVSQLWYSVIQCGRFWTLRKVPSVFSQGAELHNLYVGAICKLCACMFHLCGQKAHGKAPHRLNIWPPIYIYIYIGVATPNAACAALWIDTLRAHILHRPG